uniref:Cyclin-like domain-containing protein n=1 Tax=Ditylenchus dipsaci TaxID=166011 RepID=A0A915D6T7_9BILA
MQSRKDTGANQIGRITRGLKKSAIMDENEAQAQRRPVAKNVAFTGKEQLPFKRSTNNSRGLAERSINVTRSLVGINGKETSNELEKAKPASRGVKAMMRFGGGNMMVSVDCADDIDNYMRFMEGETALENNFLAGSAERGGVDGRMRQILVDWLIHVQRRFSLLNETLSLAVFILDRALLQMEATVDKNNLQCLGVSCIFVAAKFEEIMVPNIIDFVYVAANVFDKKEVLRMEQSVLKAIGFRCSVSHSIQFLRRYRFIFLLQSKCIISPSLLVNTVAAAAIYLSSYVHKFQIPANAYKEVMHMDEADIAFSLPLFFSLRSQALNYMLFGISLRKKSPCHLLRIKLREYRYLLRLFNFSKLSSLLFYRYPLCQGLLEGGVQ